jgi:small redox-active disulfide protein 2
LIVQIAGTGCTKCNKLYEMTVEATGNLGIACDVVKVEKIKEIVVLGVMTTPALLVDGKILLTGNLPTMEKLKEILQEILQPYA